MRDGEDFAEYVARKRLENSKEYKEQVKLEKRRKRCREYMRRVREQEKRLIWEGK